MFFKEWLMNLFIKVLAFFDNKKRMQAQQFSFKSENGKLRVHNSFGLVTKPLFIMVKQDSCPYCPAAYEALQNVPSILLEEQGIPILTATINPSANLMAAAAQSKVRIESVPVFLLFVNGDFVSTHVLKNKFFKNPEAGAVMMCMWITKKMGEKTKRQDNVPFDPNSSCYLTMDQAYQK